MRSVLFIAFAVNCLIASSQRSYITGSVVDTTKLAMSEVYIRNISAGSITSTNENGDFQIPTILGDSISITHIGYENLFVIVNENWIENGSAIFQLTPKTTFLDEVTVTKFPEYREFKGQVLSTNADDTSFQIYGVSKVVITREDRLNASLKSRGPISLMHNAFSKRAKEQKKVRKLIRNQGTYDNAERNFSREWVGELTQLSGDKLTSFIAFCDFTDSYLATTPEYIIHEEMMALLPKFLDQYEEKG